MKFSVNLCSFVRKVVFCSTSGTLLFALCFSAEAQHQKEIHKMAYLAAGSAASVSTNIDVFRRGLHDHGLVDGKNLIIEYRHAEGIESRLPHLATELVRLKPDVMFTANTSAALALKNATTTVPIVVVLTADPVTIGLVKSLARPGGNVTGLTRLSNSLPAAVCGITTDWTSIMSTFLAQPHGSGLRETLFNRTANIRGSG